MKLPVRLVESSLISGRVGELSRSGDCRRERPSLLTPRSQGVFFWWAVLLCFVGLTLLGCGSRSDRRAVAYRPVPNLIFNSGFMGQSGYTPVVVDREPWLVTEDGEIADETTYFDTFFIDRQGRFFNDQDFTFRTHRSYRSGRSRR